MKAPFPWFGGKRRVAPEIWAAFGDVDGYVEPFAGSLAVLLERPERHRGIVAGAETVNDADRFIANFWRSVSAAPDEVANWADWPVNEADLFARHMWLVRDGRPTLEAIDADPDFYDAKIAGWWVWGLCSWIGSGWCSGSGPWTVQDGRVYSGDTGSGVNRKLPHLGSAGQGVNRQLPHFGGGHGVNRSGGGTIQEYMRALQARLRRVRVCCGDWSRVVTTGTLCHGGAVGILLDPPYSDDVRTGGLYAHDDGDVSSAVRQWAIDHGEDRRLRIALCGYEGEHAMPASWRVMAWKSSGAYKGGGGDDCASEINRHKERVWFSPGCIQPDAGQIGLFGGTT